LTSEHSTPASSAPGDIFATTHWTVVLAAGQRHTPQSDGALEELCRTYWFPLYAYVRRRGHNKPDAEDLTQAFFARLLEKNFLADLDSEKESSGPFLLASLKHFLANEWDKAQGAKAGRQRGASFARLADGGHESFRSPPRTSRARTRRSTRMGAGLARKK